MAKIGDSTNSRRRFEKASYTPVKTRERAGDEVGDVLMKSALVRALGATPAELVKLRAAARTDADMDAVDAFAGLMQARDGDSALQASAALARVKDEQLISIAHRLHDYRADLISRLSNGVKELSTEYHEMQSRRAQAGAAIRTAPAAGSGSASPGDQPGVLHSLLSDAAKHTIDVVRAATGSVANPGPPRDREESATAAGAEVLGAPAAYALSRRSVASAATSLVQPSAVALQLATAHPFTSATFGTLGAVQLPAVLSWAAEEATSKLEGMLAEARPYLPSASVTSLVDLIGSLAEVERRRLMSKVFVAALTRRPLEPIGLLHLERLDMTPLQVERGELLYSLPLAPKEKVTLAHKEWTTREEEFSRYIQDVFENFSETGVAEADDIAMSSLTQARHANALSMNQSPVGSSGITITTAADASAATSTVEDTASMEQSKSQSRTVTSRASARSVRDHKVSFTVTTTSGVEDFTARVLENPRDAEAMRIDYFRRMRRWRTDLYRYGVRMTYDVVLPDPGRRLRSRQSLVRAIDQQLAAGNPFTLKPSDVTVWNWSQLADQYGAALEPPRELQPRLEVVRAVDYGPAEEVNIHGDVHTKQKVEELQVDVPADYQLSSLAATIQVSTWHVTFQQRWITVIGDGVVRSFVPDSTGHISGTVAFNTVQLPQTGAVKVSFQSQYVSNGVLKLVGTLEPRAAVIEDWRMRCWIRLRDAANAATTRQRDELRARRAVLQSEIAAVDALTLRRMEREQIMLSVLEWLFPEFDETIGLLYSVALPGSWATGVWQDIMQYGEYIKFVHEAIDWDNVMVFLFPYFWDTPGHHEEKLFLDHKDPLHREFLRAGAARVVLAIRPGFEEEVASLLDQGQLGALPDGHRFKKVAADVVAANAKYAAQAAANGDDDEPDRENPRIPGTLMGTWFDYTPTGALDIDVVVSPVTLA